MFAAVGDAIALIGAAVALAVLAFVVLWIWSSPDDLPSPKPPRWEPPDRSQSLALLQVPEWKKRPRPAPEGLVRYERPPDVLEAPPPIPDDAVLPPPRGVAGTNGEP